MSNGPATQNTFPESDYYPQQIPTNPRGGLDESTVASDFDATITSDLGVPPIYGGQDNGYYGEDQQVEQANYQARIQSRRLQPPYPQHTLQHKQSHSPIINQDDTQRRLQTSAINSHFDRPQHQFGKLAVRPAEEHVSSQLSQESRKRSRSSERTARQSTFSEDRSSQIGDLEDEEEVLEPEVEDVGMRIEEEDEDHLTPSNSPRKKRQEREPVVGDLGAGNPKLGAEMYLPEYSDTTLKKMSYADLEKEPWDRPDDRKVFQLAKPLRENDSFKAKMEHYVFKEGQDAQVSFYEQISPEDWDEGGDWFVEKFTELLNEIKLKRAEKKKCTKKFEEEISAREKLVRGKSDYLDKEFKYMRVGGEGILRGKRI